MAIDQNLVLWFLHNFCLDAFIWLNSNDSCACSKIVSWLMIVSAVYFDVWGLGSLHQSKGFELLTPRKMGRVTRILIIFEDLASKLMISYLAIASISPSDQNVYFVCHRHIIILKHLLKLDWAHITSTQRTNRVTQLLLLSCCEFVGATKMNIRGAETAQ